MIEGEKNWCIYFYSYKNIGTKDSRDNTVLYSAVQTRIRHGDREQILALQTPTYAWSWEYTMVCEPYVDHVNPMSLSALVHRHS